MRKLGLFVVLSVVLIGSNATAQMPGYMPQGADQTSLDVSLIQLIANPQHYDGKKIRLIGFLRLEFEGNALYLHQEDFEHQISANALWIEVPRNMTKEQRDAVNTKYAICEGTFNASDHGHMGMFSGELAKVTRIESWPARETIQKLNEKH